MLAVGERGTLYFSGSISSSRRDICSPDRGYPEKKVKEGVEVRLIYDDVAASGHTAAAVL